MIYPIPAETGFEMRRKIFPPMVFLPVLWYRFRVLSLPASLKPLRLASNRILSVSHTSGMTSAVLFTVYSICVQMAMAFPINLPLCRGRSRGRMAFYIRSCWKINPGCGSASDGPGCRHRIRYRSCWRHSNTGLSRISVHSWCPPARPCRGNKEPRTGSIPPICCRREHPCRCRWPHRRGQREAPALWPFCWPRAADSPSSGRIQR